MNRTQGSPAVDRILAWSIRHPLTPLARYLAATLLVGACALIRVLFITNLLPWLLFMPAVLLIGLTLGRRVGFYAALLASALAAVSIAPPGAPYWLSGPQWAASLLFVVVSSSQVMVAAELRAAFLAGRQMVAEREHILALLTQKEEQGRLLNQELGHRLKNLLTIVQVVAGQTLRRSDDLASAQDALAARLAAFGRATDVLTASTWEAADLETLARAALASHGGLGERFTIQGPPIRFHSQVALALALAFHELTTNATKYGALSTDAGRVMLTWSIEDGADDAEPHFRLRWQETGGPAVSPPSRRGFGSLMIERSLGTYFRGGTAITYAPDGLVFAIDAPLAGAQAEDGAT